MSEYQEEVLTNLLSLQAELRGDEPAPLGSSAAEAPSQEAEPAVGEDTVAVTEEGVTISHSSGEAGTGVNERLAALNERLAQLEFELRSVTKRIERMEPDLDVASVIDRDGDVNARWRSFLDLQRIVAERLDRS
jgi:hypothetical protein